tara:strand:+ start:52 stop:642 length:591 start_codon:yes stop_codon:yes gene_type:complete
MAGGGMVKALNANEMTTTPETQTPETTSTVQPPMSGGKGAGRVSPTVESRPMFQNQTPVTPPTSTSGGGKGAGRVVNPSTTIPTTPVVSREQFNTRIAPLPIPRGLDNPVFRRLGQERAMEQRNMAYDNFVNTTPVADQEGFLASNPPLNPANPSMTGTSMTMEEFKNRMRPPQTGGLGSKAIFKQGGLIGLMGRR